MIISFKTKATRDIYDGVSSREARKFPNEVWPAAQRKMDMINAVTVLADLNVPPGNRFQRLRGIHKGSYSIRVNDQYRIIFEFRDGNASEVQITDYH